MFRDFLRTTGARWAAALLLGLAPSLGWAQASACNANEDVVTFQFGAATATGAAGGTGTWTASALGPFSYRVGTTTGGAITQNSVTFTASIDAGPAWSQPGGAGANAPRQATYGNYPNSLALAMTGAAPGQGTHLQLNFNRPMDKLLLVMTDVDYSANNWQDILRVSGSLNGNTVVAPNMSVSSAASYTVALNNPSAGFTQVTASNTSPPNCGTASTACNVTVTFANPVDAVRIDFVAGNPGINPSVGQVVTFQNFAYCVPRRELSLIKADTTPTFVAGGTGTYTLTITNQGGTQTLAGSPILVQDILPAGMTFINPQAPGGGWTCALATTNFANDTANCDRGTTVMAGGGASIVLTLTVSLSPDLTATSVDNRAKVAGGGDPNKTAIATTGPVSSCTAANEGWDGGGATYASGGTTNAGCGFENTLVIRRSLLTITKTNNVTSVVSGGTTAYVITVANSGPSSAPGLVLTDPVALGLSCSTPTFVSNPVGSVTTLPTVLTVAALQSGGVSLTPTFPANSTATFTLPCTITATGYVSPLLLPPLVDVADAGVLLDGLAVADAVVPARGAAASRGAAGVRRTAVTSWAGAPSGTPSGPPGSGGSSG